MATGPDHYREAERLAADAAYHLLEHSDWDAVRACAELAQVHATLAQTAAIAMQAAIVGECGPGMTADEYAAWYEVSGAPGTGEPGAEDEPDRFIPQQRDAQDRDENAED
jgi:hypothetical protein